MHQLRDITIAYLEKLDIWRSNSLNVNLPDFQNQTDFQNEIFMWEEENYTIKLITDLDFLAENIIVVETLGIPEHQLIANPLMLPNNLENPLYSDWEEENPHLRAKRDIQEEWRREHGDGNMDELYEQMRSSSKTELGKKFQWRVKQRISERLLVREIALMARLDSGILL